MYRSSWFFFCTVFQLFTLVFCFGDQVLSPGSSLATDFLGVVPLWRVAQRKFFQPWRSTGPNGQLPCILDRQRRLPKTLRDYIRSASALSALKKSLVTNLSAKRQLSVAKLSAKRIFSLAKWDFLVANGRMAADFSSPGEVCGYN